MPEDPAGDPLESWIGRALLAFVGQMETVADAVPATRALFRFEEQLTGDPEVARALAGLGADPGAESVIRELARAIAARRPPILPDREAFRQVAGETGRALGLKGRALYHPIRVALTGAEKGPELDRLVPIIEEGAGLPLPSKVLSCLERAERVAARLAGQR